MLQKENINVPEVSESPIHGVGYKPLTGGTLYFTAMKIIEDLGVCLFSNVEKNRRHCAIFECPYCGKHFKSTIKSINRGKKSCGCAAHLTTTRHGLGNTLLYRIWAAMKQRCLNPNNRGYHDYGGRGIAICQDWIDDYLNFYRWASETGYQKGLELDRENNDKGYSPENCRWVDRTTNVLNSRVIRSNNTTGYRGVYFNKWENPSNGKRWLAYITVKKHLIRLGYYKTKKEAAIVRNNYIIENDLIHPLNKIV